MKKALLIGINQYNAPIPELKGCVNDARSMYSVLSRHYNESPNFSCKLLTCETHKLIHSEMRKEIMNFFKEPADVLLFFFAGHGYENQLGGSLVTQDATRYDEGIPMSEIIGWATLAIERYRVREVVLILDCCHSGHLGAATPGDSKTLLPEGISILTSSGTSQYSAERGGNGLFTAILLEALNGGAGDMQGHVTVADLYSFADQLLGPWDQRPTFKTNISHLTPLRYCKPRIEASLLRKLIIYFPSDDFYFALDPSFEPTEEPHNEKNETIFAELQAFRAAGLVEPVGVEHMYYAAVYRKSCRLTALGKFYRKMINAGKA